MRTLILVLALMLSVAAPLWAQDVPATLVADRLAITGADTLVAEGSVEVFYQGRRLRARRITYDRAADKLLIDGPIVLTDAVSGDVVLADEAELSGDLRDGILRSARLVLDQQLQLAASEMMRIGGRYTRLGRTVASSCKVCAGSPTPLWEIRARRVLHDATEKQIYFDRAQVRFFGVPVALIPRLRMPDPTLKRSRGVLLPAFRSNSDLGTGIKLPYFIPIGPSRDVTLTPFISTNGGRTLELRYRQAFRTGKIELNGAVSRDRILPDKTRGYIMAEGTFALPRDFKLKFSATTVSDRGYLLDYNVADSDRLESKVEVARTRRDQYISVGLTHFRSLRDTDTNDTLPSLIGDLTWVQRFTPAGIGGIATLTFSGHGHRRSSSAGFDSDGNGVSDGRDTARAGVRAEWRRDGIVGPGFLVAALAEVRADVFDISQDDASQGSYSRLTGAAALELRYPLTRITSRGAVQVIEPVVQLVLAPESAQDGVPNEDGVLAEFDEGNLFSLNRFPGYDGVEEGPRVNAGLSFTHFAPSGWQLGMTLGRVFRTESATGFSAASGLSGPTSDWLAAWRLSGRGLAVTNRLLFADDFSLTKAELRLDMARERYAVSSSYVWTLADDVESRTTDVSELVFDGRFQMSPNWAGTMNTRYDFVSDRAARAGLGLEFRNECLRVDLSLSRRFTSSSSVSPTTDVGLSVELLGFGGGSSPGPARACRG